MSYGKPRKRTPSPSGIRYQSGGNPPIAPGLFTDNGERLAWWPATHPANADNIERVVMQLVWKREDDNTITREQINALLSD